MKKTYIKITVLICALVIAVMMLGGTLFTYVMISRINSDYMNEIQRAVNYRPIDYNQHITDTDPDFVMMTYNIDKMYSCTDNPDIGYYGTNEWRLTIGGGSHIMYSTDFVRANAVMDSETGDGVYVRLVPSNDGTGDAIVYFSNSEGDTEYWGVSTSSDAEEGTGDKSVEFSLGNKSDYQGYINPLNLEAKDVYDKIVNADSGNDKVVEETHIGWRTSYAYYLNSSYLYNNDVYVVISDAFVYHPLAIVFERYAYAFYLFPFVLIILLALTIFTMRRMYVNRMRYETRTRNLTRSFAHELKTPLAVTKSYVENWDIVGEAERPLVAEKINFEVDHMTKMVNTLLDLSKMDAGDVKLNLEDVELFDLSRVCLNHMEELARSRNITVELENDSEDGDYAVSADLDMIRMVISNFLSNAIKYGKEKAVIKLANSGNNVIFRITNDGEPISKKDQKKIWDLFYKKDKSGSDRLSSNGVGLAVNKSILELHKAKFGVDSSAEGTTFWFEMKKAKQ